MITIIPLSLKVLGRRESERSTQWRFLELWPACEVQTATDEALLDAIFYFTVIQHDFFLNLLPPPLFGTKMKNIAKGTTDPGVDCFDQ